MELQLSPEEGELLRAILADHHSELFREISRTEHHHFKTGLRQKEATLDSIRKRLEGLLEQACAGSHVSRPRV